MRILSPVLGDQKETGSVVSATSDTLFFFRPVKLSPSIAIGTPNIVGIEVARGTDSRKLKGAPLGLLTRTGVGAIIGYASYTRPSPCNAYCFDFGAGFSAPSGADSGAFLGTVVGTLVSARQVDTWVAVTLPRG